MLKILFFLAIPFLGSTEGADISKVSEAVGHMIGKNLDALGLDFDLDAIVKGLKEESEGKSSPLNEDDCVQAIANLQEEKMSTEAEQELEHADAASNGDLIYDDIDHENHPFPAADPAKHR